MFNVYKLAKGEYLHDLKDSFSVCLPKDQSSIHNGKIMLYLALNNESGIT